MASRSSKCCVFCHAKDVPESNRYEYAGQTIWVCAAHHDAFRGGIQFANSRVSARAAGLAPAAPAGAALPSPREICKHLGGVVVGQQKAKELISLAVHQHYANIAAGKQAARTPHHILLAGPSGCGKTLLARTIGEKLHVPFLTADSTCYTPSGYVGMQADDLVLDLLPLAGQDPNRAARGVVFLDEVDKLANKPAADGHVGEFRAATQASLLRLMEGRVVRPDDRAVAHGKPNIAVDSSTVLFIFAGAFDGLVEMLDHNTGKIMSTPSATNPIGFRRVSDAQARPGEAVGEATRRFEILSSVGTHELLVALEKYGMMPELLGRIPSIVALAPLTRDELCEVATSSNQSPLEQVKRELKQCGYEVKFTDEFVQAAADRAYLMATGTRALKSVVQEATRSALYTLLGTKGGGSVVFGAETLTDPSAYSLIESAGCAAA